MCQVTSIAARQWEKVARAVRIRLRRLPSASYASRCHGVQVYCAPRGNPYQLAQQTLHEGPPKWLPWWHGYNLGKR